MPTTPPRCSSPPGSFFNRQTGEIKEQQVFLGDFPIMTEKGSSSSTGPKGSWSASPYAPQGLLRPDAGQDPPTATSSPPR